MVYKIYELVGKSKSELDGYDITTVTHYKLEELRSDWCSLNEYPSFEEARAYLVGNRSRHKNMVFTILPIIEIEYDGEIRGAK